MGTREVRDVVDGVPVVLLVPDGGGDTGGGVGGDLVLWMSHLGGSADKERPTLEAIAARGCPAVSFDLPLHGARAVGDDPWAFAGEVLAHYRRRMWPLLGQGVLEAMRVLTWAQEALGSSGPVAAGGVSMGGDVAVALAGVDERVVRVAGLGSTPDWSRPDMRDLRDPERVVDQGEPDAAAAWWAARLDPMRHLDRYDGRCAVRLGYGGADQHIPATQGIGFRDALAARSAAAGAAVVVEEYPGLDHLGVTSEAEPIEDSVTWLAGEASG